MDRRRAAVALLALAACIACTSAAPTASNQTALDLYESDASEGCYYNFQHYGEGDRIMTNEPCLNCTCHNRMLMCYLRVCPFTKAIGQDCTVEKRADQCCPIVTCPDVPVDLLTSTSTSSPAEYGTTGLGRLDKYGCSMNGKYFPEGSKVPPSPNKPCEHCYCIRNMTTCVMQECTLHVDGCTPIYHKDVCCPVRYSCDHPEDEIPLLDDMTTTVRPTPGFLLTTTTMPSVTQIPQDCVHDDQIFSDGALIKTEKACEHCYCMKGDIVCVVQECGTPMENEGKNCTSLVPKEGQCCPDTYICEGDNELQTDDITTLIPPRRSGVEGSGYRNEDEYTVQPTVFEPELEGSGVEGSGLEGSELEGSGDEYKTDKPASTSDVATAQEVTTTVIPIESDILITSEAPVFIPISTESPSLDSEKYTTEPDKGQNTVPSEEETMVPLVRETTISSVDMHTPEQETVETTATTEEQNTETPSEVEKDNKLGTTITPESHSTLPDSIVTSGEMFKTTVKSAPAESITSKQTEESVTDASEILKPLATTTEKQQLSETQTIIPLDEKESKSTTVQLPDDTHESVETVQPQEVTTETSVEVSTTGDIKDKYSETTVPTEQEDSQYTTSSKFEIPETTSINTIENEIQEEQSHIASPGIIPGEGNCLVNGITYSNDSAVPSTNKCQANCKCMSSIVKCDPIMCSGPPENMVNCQPVYDTDETCCPTFICDHGKETIPPQPHSQMSGTESPVTQEVDCQTSECRRQENDVAAPTPSPECLEGNCLNETDKKGTNECGTTDCGEQASTAEPSKAEVTKQPEVCLDGNCISPPESCVGDKCQLPIHKDQPCDKDNGCDISLAEKCEGPNCNVEITPPKKDTPTCDSEADCGQSGVPDVIQTCEGEECVNAPSELPSSEIPQPECNDEFCTKKEAAELDSKFGTDCKDEACTGQVPVQSIPKTDDVKTESPVILDESGTISPVSPVIEEDDKRTETVTTLSDIAVTKGQDSVTESIQVDITESPVLEEEPIDTKVIKPVEPSVVDTIVTEPPLDSETKSPTESPELSATEPTMSSEKEAEIPVDTNSEVPTTEQPLREGPVTEQQEMATKSSQTPIAEEQEISSVSSEVTTLGPKSDTESPKISEKPVVAEYPTTESRLEISKTTGTLPVEENIKPTEVSETSVTEPEKTSIKVTETSEEEKQIDLESPITEELEIVTKTSEVPVSDEYPVTISQEIATKSTEQSPITETQEMVTKVVDTSDISDAAITQPQDEATNLPEVLVTEIQEKTTDVPVAVAHVEEPQIPDGKEKTTESYEKPEYSVTDSEEKVPVVPESPVSEEENTPESTVTESQEETSITSEAPISAQKPETTVTDTNKPLREGSVTEPQDLGTEAPDNLATEAPETASSESKDKISEIPKETEVFVTESEEKATEVPKVTESEEKSTEAPKVTESEKYGTEDNKEPETVTESEGQVTEVPIVIKPTESDITKSEDHVTESPKEPETTAADVTEIEETVTDAPKETEADVTPLVEKSTEAAILTVTESQEKLTAIPEEPKPAEEQESPESTITEAQEKPTDAPESTVSGHDNEVDVTESEVKASLATESPIPSGGQQSCDEESGCDVPLTQPCNGPECGVDTMPPKEVPIVCDNKENCEQSAVPEIPVRKCEGESCQQLPVSNEKQEPPATETIHNLPGISDTPDSDDKQDKPEFSATETPKVTTESPKVHVPESEEKSTITPEVAQEPEVPTTESETPLREGSVTETQELGTLSPGIPTVAVETIVTESQEKESESPEMSISDHKPETLTTEFGEKATESPEELLSGEKQDITVSPLYSEKATESPETPTLSGSDSQEDTTKSPDTDNKQELPDQPITEYIEKETETSQTPISDQEAEEVSDAPATESTEMLTKTSKQPQLDEKQDIPISVTIETEKETTDKPLRDGSVTESVETGTQSPEIPTVVTELLTSEKETESFVTEPTKLPFTVEKQDMPESPVTSPVTESHEKTTDGSEAPEQFITDKQEEATKASEIQDEQTTDRSETESQEIGTQAPEISFEDHHISGEQPATETQELATNLPEIVTSGEQETHTEAPVSLVTGLQEEHGVSVAAVTESQEPTTRIQETPAPEKLETPMSPKVTEATEATLSGEQEVPESPATESQEKATARPVSDEKQRIPEEPVTDLVEKETEMSVTESQEKEIPKPEVTEQLDTPEIQEKDSEVPQTQEKPTETPILDEKPATESEDIATMAPVEVDSGENVKTSKSPVPDFEDMATEVPDAIISEQETKIPDTSVSEADKPLREGSATEQQDLGTEAPEIEKATGVPEIQTPAPKVPESESQPSETEAPGTESEEDAITGPKVPVSEQKPEEPETQETPTETPELLVTEYQGTGTPAPEIPEEEPQTPAVQEKATESPEVSEAPEYQEKVTEIPKPLVPAESPQVPDSEQEITNAPLSGEEQTSSVMIPQEKPTDAPEAASTSQDTESPEVLVTDTQEKATEAPEKPTTAGDQESAIAAVTELQETGTKSTDAPSSEIPKQEYSETTPYLVELEEHTHKIEDEISTITPEDVTTLHADEKPIVETEKPSFIPDMETISVAPTTLQEPLSTEAGMLDGKFGEPSEDQEVSKAPERTGEEQTPAPEVPIEMEKDTSTQSTEKPFESSASPEPSAPEEEPLPSRTTTAKAEEETTTPALFDKFTKPEPKPSEETYTPEIPKPTTTGQLSDDLPLPEDEAGQFPPSGSTGYGQEPDYVEEDQAFGPGTCRYGGKVYVSAQQIPRDDPCDFCFCFRSDIICLQQSCPPPIHGCHEEPISGFCCPRYECPVSMATTLNVTTTTTTTTTTLPPHFLPHAYKGQAQRRGCQIKGHTYKVGEVVRASSGPCLHCTCGGDGQMKCDPKQCTPEPMLRQMIAAAVSAKRRR